MAVGGNRFPEDFQGISFSDNNTIVVAGLGLHR